MQFPERGERVQSKPITRVGVRSAKCIRHERLFSAAPRRNRAAVKVPAGPGIDHTVRRARPDEGDRTWVVWVAVLIVLGVVAGVVADHFLR